MNNSNNSIERGEEASAQLLREDERNIVDEQAITDDE